jgi:uncharacterized membrane protein (DUF373 family)
MNQFLKIYERVIVFALIFLLGLVILLATVDLVRKIVTDLLGDPLFLLSVNQLLDIFGYVLLILIGVELVETIKTYFTEHVVHTEVVLEVALIAIARKVIIVDTKEMSPMMIIGIAVLVIALSLGYFLEKRARSMEGSKKESPVPPVLY